MANGDAAEANDGTEGEERNTIKQNTTKEEKRKEEKERDR